MAEATHREKAQTVGTLTTTMTMVLTRASRKVLSWTSLVKFCRPTKEVAPAWACMFASVRLVPMQMIMGMTTKPRKKIRLGSRNR